MDRTQVIAKRALLGQSKSANVAAKILSNTISFKKQTPIPKANITQKTRRDQIIVEYELKVKEMEERKHKQCLA